MASDQLEVAQLAEVMQAYRTALSRHQATINRLNVFPVPDGDTGTNMLLTLDSVITELATADKAPGAVLAAIAKGSLMGARGNSGVILCQLLRGLTETFERADQLDAANVATAMAVANDAARRAVLRPVEGTILTVAAGAAAGAAAAAAASAGHAGALLDVLVAARAGAVEALWATPSLLSVLKEAGVVDAGGAGLVLLFDAFLFVAADRPLPDELELPPEVAATMSRSVAPDALTSAHFEPQTPGSNAYEVMFLLDADDDVMDSFKQTWGAIGDSIVVVGGGGTWNCHIHTDDIGASIEAGIAVGRPHAIRVTDLREQVEEEQWVRSAGNVSAHPSGDERATAVVAVATGEGISEIFRSLGVDQIVAGGQSMNPSTAEILAAIEQAHSRHVIVLPNNANVIASARQAVDLTDKEVVILPTKGMQEAFAALLEYDPEADGGENAKTMGAAAGRVVAGEVTRAVRDVESPAGHVHAGDFIGLSRAGVESIARTAAAATCALIDRLVEPDHELITLIEGAGADPGEVKVILTYLDEHHGSLMIERHHGGQPLYPFLVAIE